MTKILLDATVMQQAFTGVAKVTHALYENALKLDPFLEVKAVHREPLSMALTSGIDSLQRGTYFPRRYWRAFFIPTVAWWERSTVVHFPWNGNVPKFLASATVVTTLHDVLPLEIPAYFNSDEAEQAYRVSKQKDIDRTDLLITDSTYSKRKIIENFSLKKEPLVIYPGATLSLNRMSSKMQQEHLSDYFLYVGGYDPRKGLLPLLKAFETIHQQKKLTSKLLLTGSPRYFSSEFKNLVKSGVEQGIVEERGYVSDEELVELYLGAKALIYPSQYEGFGLPVLEAMTFGCPVITTRGTSIPEVCGLAAYYIEPHEEKSMANALITLEHDKSLRDTLRMKGLQQAKRFSWSKAAELYLDALNDTMTARKRVGPVVL